MLVLLASSPFAPSCLFTPKTGFYFLLMLWASKQEIDVQLRSKTLGCLMQGKIKASFALLGQISTRNKQGKRASKEGWLRLDKKAR
jgi:hypothetical protein